MRIVLPCLNLPNIGSEFAVVKIAKFLLLFIFLSVVVNQTQAQHDLEIASISDVDSAGVGDEVTFTITLYNEGRTVFSGVEVTNILPANMTYVSDNPAIGSYSSSTGIWNLMSSFTDSVKLELTARLDAPGVHYNVAEVTAMDGFDVDSEPNDGIITDDDYTSSCVSVPFKICTEFNDTIVLTAPTGYDDYQWALDGVDIGGATSQVYKATQPGEYTFTADNILTNCNGGSCCPIEIENACFDLALDKKLAASQTSDIVSPGDDVTYTITIHNQGDYYADSIEITDYIPTGMVNNTNNWGGNDTLLTIADGQLAPDGLAPNSTFSVDITLTVSSPTAVDSLLNYAEISSARDASGTDSRDIDSTPDATNSDPGGASNSAADDYVDGNGQGTVDDGVASTDEDDHDVEVIYICPTIAEITADFAICPNDAVGMLSVTTSTTDDIHFVYFSSVQTGSNMYSGGTSLGSVTPSGGTASITAGVGPTTPGTYYIYAIIDPSIDNGSCEPFEEIELTVNPDPTVVVTDPSAVCAGTVDVTSASVGSPSGGTLSYYASSADASSGMNPLTGASITAVSSTSTIHVRYELSTGCFVLDEIEVTVNPDPTVVVTDPSAVCAGTVDVTSASVGSPSGGTLSYYASSADASSGMNPLTGASITAVSSTSTIHVRYELSTGCFVLDEIEVTVNPDPTVVVTDPSAVCAGTVDVTSASVGSPSGGTLSYYASSADASSGMNPLTGASITAVSSTSTIHVRYELSTGCFVLDEIEVTVNPDPTVVVTDPSAVCAGTVDVTSASVGSPSGGTLSYYASSADASSGMNPLTGASITAVSSTSTIHVRYELSTGCFVLDEIEVTVNPDPTVVVTDPSAVCAGTVDVTSASVGSPSGGTLSYYASSADASSGMNPLTGASITAVSSTSTIHVRYELSTGCFVLDEIEVTVNPDPTVVVTDPSAVCAGTVDVTSASVGSPSGGTLSYYASSADASSGMNPLTGASITAVSSTSTIHVRYELSTGCFVLDEIEVTVNPDPTVVVTDPSAVCAGTVDVTSASVGSPSGGTLSYYASSADASSGMNPLTGTSITAVSSTSTIHVRYELSTGCFVLDEIEVTVNPDPTVVVTDPSAVCAGTVDVTSASVGSPSGGTLSYYASSADASSGMNPLTGASITAVSSTSTIHVRYELSTGCFVLDEIEVTVNPDPTVVVTDPSAVCAGTVDVTSASVGSPSGGTLSYYASSADASSGMNPLTGASITAVSSTSTIHVRYELSTGCFVLDEIEVTVNPDPTVVVTDPSAVCAGTVDVTSASVGSPSGGTLSYYASSADASSGMNPLTGASITAVSSTSTIHVRYELSTGCFVLDEIEVTVNPDPTVVVTDPSAVCAGTVDVTSASVGSPSGGTLSYYASSADASSGMNPLTGTSITAVSSTSTIHVRYELSTGCFVLDEIEVTVNPDPTVVVTDPSAVCAGTVDVTSASVGSPSGGTLSYYASSADASSGMNPLTGASITAVSSTSTIHVRYELSTGCFVLDEIEVTVNPDPTVVVTDPSAVCAGTVDVTSASVGSPSGGTLSYYASSADASSGMNPLTGASITAVSSTSTIHVRYELSTGCFVLDEIEVTVNPDPTVVVTDPSAVCAGTVDVTSASVGSPSGGTLSYYASSADASSGMNPLTGASITAVSSTSTIHVRYELSTGCFVLDEIEVTVNPDPTVVVTDPSAVCAGTVDVTSASVGSPSGGTLSYYASSADASSGMNPLTGASITAVSSTSTIHVRYELSTGCFVLDEIEVTVNPDPTVVVASNTPCVGDALNLTESGNGTNWSWTGPNSFTSAVQNPIISNVTSAAAGRYYVTVTNDNTCSKLDSVDVVINLLPTLTLEVTDDTICSGGTARIEVINPEAGVTYQLVRAGGTMGSPISDIGGMGVAFNLTGLTDTVTYLIEVVNGNGCRDTLNDPAIIYVPDCDFGDLPDASIAGNLSADYETVSADNGPYHYIIPMLSLGNNIDGEVDASPDGMAIGDDDDIMPDDEDGITFFSTLNIVPGGTIKLPIEVVNGTGTTAYLEGWIDWNGDGTLDAGEIIVDIDDSTTAFPAFITVAVPAVIADNIPIGVRFRLSHTPDMTPYGKAESGEIEDYLIQIDCATGTCIPMSSIIKRGARD